MKESDSSMHYAEALQLHRAAKAFLVNIQEEYDAGDANKKLSLSSAKAFTYSTLLNLYDMHCCMEGDTIRITDEAMTARIEMQAVALQGLRAVSQEVIIFGEQITALLIEDEMRSTSPLLCECVYQAAAYYAWHFRESKNEASLNALNRLRQTLGTIQVRWHVAGG